MLKRIVKGFGLLVLVSVSSGCWNHSFAREAQDRAAQEKVNEQHAAADIEGDRILQSRIASFQQLGILGEKVAESKADSCFIKELISGFSVETWAQFCQLDYLAGYTAPLSREETHARLRTLHEEDPTFPWQPSLTKGCWHGSWPSSSVRYVPANSNGKWIECRIPNIVNYNRSQGARSPGSTKFDYTFDRDAIDQSVDLLWISYTHGYYQEDLGCKGFLCMDSPRSAVIQAD